MRTLLSCRKAVVSVGLAAAVPVAAPAVAFAHGYGPPPETSLNQQDRDFLEAAGHGAAAEITSGGLAVRRGSAPGTRYFGWGMQSDHASEAAQLAAVGEEVHVAVPRVPNARQDEVYLALRSTAWQEFDCAYLAHEVEDHGEDVEAYKVEVENGSNHTVRAFAERWLPKLHVHLTWARDLSEELGCVDP